MVCSVRLGGVGEMIVLFGSGTLMGLVQAFCVKIGLPWLCHAGLHLQYQDAMIMELKVETQCAMLNTR